MLTKIKEKLYIAYLKTIRHPWEGNYYRRKADLSHSDIIPDKHNYFLGIVAIFKGEDDYLREWLEFHILMGVEHFILYDNGLEESSKLILQPYIKTGIVTHIPFPNIPGLKDGRHAHTLSLQQMAYADCIKRFKHHFKFLLQLDIDEFLFPKAHKTLIEILKNYEYNNIARIEINWTNFGNNSHVKKPQGLVIENFSRSGDEMIPHTVKSISNTQYLSKYFVYSNVHRFNCRLSIKDMLTKAFFNYPKIIKNSEANNLFQLNHYITKSQEEYIKKAQRFKKGWQTGKKTEKLFELYTSQYNMISNISILRFLPKLIESLKHNSK